MEKLKWLVNLVASWYSLVMRRVALTAGLMAGLCLLAMTLMVTMDVTLRYGFNAPTAWVNEFSSYLAVIIVFLGISYVLREDAHIRVDVVVRKLPRRGQDWMRVITSIAFLAYTVILFRLTWDIFVLHFTINKTSFTAMDVPLWPTQFFIPLGLAIMGLLLIHRIYAEVKAALQKGS